MSERPDIIPNNRQQGQGFDQHVLERRIILGGFGTANQIFGGLFLRVALRGRLLTMLAVGL
jgi:hypothetical protein